MEIFQCKSTPDQITPVKTAFPIFLCGGDCPCFYLYKDKLLMSLRKLPRPKPNTMMDKIVSELWLLKTFPVKRFFKEKIFEEPSSPQIVQLSRVFGPVIWAYKLCWKKLRQKLERNSKTTKQNDSSSTILLFHSNSPYFF